MISKEKMRLDVKWATRQRLQYIEIMAWYSGVVTRSDVAKAFGLSDAAATKDLKLYSDLAPGNLVYNHSVFGFVPSDGFSRGLCRPHARRRAAHHRGQSGGRERALRALTDLRPGRRRPCPCPPACPVRRALAQITRAIHGRRKLRVSYRSLRTEEQPARRSACSNPTPWSIPASAGMCAPTRGDLRLSRFRAVAHRRRRNAWMRRRIRRAVRRRLGGDRSACSSAPHSGLDALKRESLLLDYGASGGRHRGRGAARPARLRAATP